MEAEFARLEEKVSQLVLLCAQLRTENQSLRQQLEEKQQESQTMKLKVEGAIERVAAILAKLPEETQ